MSSHLFQNPENPNEIIRGTPWGDIPAWKASSLATGTMGAYTEYLKQVRADTHLVHDAINAREEAVSRREAEISAREALIHDAVTKVHALLNRCDAIVSAEEERREQENTEEPVVPPSNDEGDLEVKPAKSEDLEGDLQHPENSDLPAQLADQAEVEFPQFGEPEEPDPDEPRAPSAFEDN
jgi:hypothetical protein